MEVMRYEHRKFQEEMKAILSLLKERPPEQPLSLPESWNIIFLTRSRKSIELESSGWIPFHQGRKGTKGRNG